MKLIFNLTIALGIFVLGACVSVPKLDPAFVRQWAPALENEFPQQAPALVHYKKGPYELFYVAARHENSVNGDTLSLVTKLFNYDFDLLVIEPFAFSYGKSPSWYMDESKKGLHDNFIVEGESGWGVIQADKKHIPFYGGEPDHKDIYKGLKSAGYNDEDFLGFYLVRQIPEWIRQKENPKGLIERKGPGFIENYCKQLSMAKCSTVSDLKKWYKGKTGHELVSRVSNEETAPYADGKYLTQRMSSQVGKIRNDFTLERIQDFFHQYKRIAIIYGASHFVVLRKSFDAAFGEPKILNSK